MDLRPQAYFYYNAVSFYRNARRAWAEIPEDPKKDASIREINAQKLSRKICRDNGWDLAGVEYFGFYLDEEKRGASGELLPDANDIEISMAILEKMLDIRLHTKGEAIIVFGTSTGDFHVSLERMAQSRESGTPITSCALKIGDAFLEGCTQTIEVTEEDYKAFQRARHELTGKGAVGSAGAARATGKPETGAGSWSQQNSLTGRSSGTYRKVQAEVFEEKEGKKFQKLDAFGHEIEDEDDLDA